LEYPPFEKPRPPLDGEEGGRLVLYAGAFEREFPLGAGPLFPEPAQGGRFAFAERAVWLFPLGRSADPLPNPCGARPRSVVFPCADQFREPLFPGRLDEALPFAEARPFTPLFVLADGGRLLESSRCREDIEPLLTWLPWRLFGDADAPALLRAPKPPLLLFVPRFTPPLPAPFPTRPAESPRLSIVRTGICEAAAAGAVRATTERFVTEAGGVDTRPRAFAEPVKLLRVGVKSARLVTCAPRSEASFTRIDPRLIACPFTNALREAAVTARVLCAYA
jgi:hypothetical protein